MCGLNFKQLQLRILTLLFLLFSSAVIGYRYFIELPKLEHNITVLAKKELSLLQLSIQEELDALFRINYDYAVWTSTYAFMKDHNSTYIDENVIVNTL